MADSSIPFALGAENVPLVEDLIDVPIGQSLTIDLLVSGLLPTDVPASLTLVIKTNPNSSNDAPTTIIKTITATPSAAGVLAATVDPTVWRAVFSLTRREGVRISNHSPMVYSIVAAITRSAVDYTRMIQRGALSVNLYAVENDSPLADGTWFADGSLIASGFDS